MKDYKIRVEKRKCGHEQRQKNNRDSMTTKELLNVILKHFPLESFGLAGWRAVIRRRVPKRIDGMRVLVPKVRDAYRIGGYCCHRVREIGLMPMRPMDAFERFIQIIVYFHEVAHATLPEGESHGRAWKLRYRKLLRRFTDHVDFVLALDGTYPAWKKKVPDLGEYLRQLEKEKNSTPVKEGEFVAPA